MWPFLVVVSTPSLQLFGRICKRQKPMGAQEFSAETTVEGFNEGIPSGGGIHAINRGLGQRFGLNFKSKKSS